MKRLLTTVMSITGVCLAAVGLPTLANAANPNVASPNVYMLDRAPLQTMVVPPASMPNTQPATITYSAPIYYGTEGSYPFSKAVRAGNTLYLSGELGMKDGKVVTGGIQAETRQALRNINQTLLQYGYQKSDLVKCMVMLDDMGDFNAFNEVYKAELSHPYPVRSAFEVSALALGASVEIECMAVK